MTKWIPKETNICLLLLTIPERDITSPSGRKLTLINPVYTTRQPHELSLDYSRDAVLPWNKIGWRGNVALAAAPFLLEIKGGCKCSAF